MSENLHVVNAFTANGENGNPAGVVLGADSLSRAAMLSIAATLGLSETAFVSESDTATYKVQFFTPELEEPLCGHATIATWTLLHELEGLSSGAYTQETEAGLLEVAIHDDGLIFMEQTAASFYEEIIATDIADMLGLQEIDFHDTLPPQIVSTGIKDLLIPIVDSSVLKKLKPDFGAISAFSKQHRVSGFHVFGLLEAEDSLASARNFAPADGIHEECATGTSNGALLSYLRARQVLPTQDIYRIEQGEAMGRLSYVYGTFKGDTVWIGGHAKVMEQRKMLD
jgi:PhzF family phenazine biosynthesis protein